jgi:hypothetical protein
MNHDLDGALVIELSKLKLGDVLERHIHLILFPLGFIQVDVSWSSAELYVK